MSLQRLDGRFTTALHDARSTRLIEHQLASQLAPHTLMRRAGQSIGRLAMAVAAHAQTVWIACGPGNNGGDGLEAALFLHQAGMSVRLTHFTGHHALPFDAEAALLRAHALGIPFVQTPPALRNGDLIIDCLLGIGANQAVSGEMAAWIEAMNDSEAMVLCADSPTGLDAQTGWPHQTRLTASALAQQAN